MKHSFENELTTILVSHDAISQKEAIALEYAFYQSDADEFEDFLLEEGLVADNDLLDALSQYYKVPAFDVVGHFFHRLLLKKFPKSFLLRNGIIPLDADNESIVIVATDPSMPGLTEEIAHYVSYDIYFMVGIRRDICDAVKEFYDPADTEINIDKKNAQEDIYFDINNFDFWNEG